MIFAGFDSVKLSTVVCEHSNLLHGQLLLLMFVIKYYHKIYIYLYLYYEPEDFVWMNTLISGTSDSSVKKWFYDGQSPYQERLYNCVCVYRLHFFIRSETSNCKYL